MTLQGVINSTKEVPDHVKGEPPFVSITWTTVIIQIIKTTTMALFFFTLSSLLWIPCILGFFFYGYPPHITTPTIMIKMFYYVFNANPTTPPIPLKSRLFIFFDLFRVMSLVPFGAAAWYLDELLYGEKLNSTPIINPFFEISAGRSGSTQLGHYLSEDPDLIYPPQAYLVYPYLWFWKLMEMTAGKFISKESLNNKIVEGVCPEFLERHEFNIWKPDTFEIPFLQSTYRFISLSLGPEAAKEVFNYCPELGKKTSKGSNPLTKWIWERDDDFWDTSFADYLERIVKKTLYYNDFAGEGDKRRLFIKGHFVPCAKVLADRYPGATFLCMARKPHQSCQSGLNFIHSDSHPALGRLDWRYIGASFVTISANYCAREMEVFDVKEGEKGYGGCTWCAVRFDDYVVDLGVVVRHIYKHCWGGKPIPSQIPLEHIPRRRHGYSFNRSLEDIGVDVPRMKEQLADYYRFCEPVLTAKKEE